MLKTITALVACLTAVAAMGQETAQPVLLHGFGEWAYVRTDGNEFLDGNEDGDYDTVGLGLNVTKAVGDNLMITGQLALRSGEQDKPVAELDYAFAQWRFSDALQLRLGRAKHPFGIYTEFFDVGTLRPFFHLPLSIYGPTEIAAQSYNGVGLTGNRQTGGNSSFDYDVYAGEITFEAGQRYERSGQDEQLRDVLGARLRFNTPISGLSFGASGYLGKTEEEGEEGEEAGEEEGEEVAEGHLEEAHRKANGVGLQAEYAMLPLTIRAEVGRHYMTEEGDALAFYVEAGYRIGERLEAAGRYDSFDKTDDNGDPVAEHRDIAVGLNYWFNPNLVLKLSLHQVEGFGAVLPVGDDPDDKTTVLVFGTQFSF